MKYAPLLLSLLAGAALCGCSGGNSGSLTPLTDEGGERTAQFGPFTTRVAGTAQPPVTSTGSGSTVTGIAGATITSMTLTQPQVVLEQTKIAFSSNRTGNYQLYVMNADGTNVTRLTYNSFDDSNPAWSPDSKKMAFSREEGGKPALYVMNADGTGQSKIFSDNADTIRGYDVRPSWSPDGARIAFVGKFRDNNKEIYTIKADGADLKRLTSNSVAEDNPAYSLDGTKIGFSSQRDISSSDIYVMNANDGSNVQRLTSSGNNDGPVWSPDGTRIAFHSKRDGDWEIYLMHEDGSNQQKVTNNSISDVYPSWSPDGAKIVFASNRSSVTDQIHVMNADGSNQTPLTTASEGQNLYATWSWATTLRTRLIGTNGLLATIASGFLYGRNGDAITSLLVFDATAEKRASTRVTTSTGIANGLSNYSFLIANPEKITSLAFTNNLYAQPSVVIGSGGLAAASSVLVDYNAATGKVIAVLPFESNRAAVSEMVQTQGTQRLYRGSFLGVWNAEGKNIAPGGASEVRVEERTGRLEFKK